jgi:uncharacterized protein YabN with tetrapyrrole methylase and pyrophosphatase domain
VRSLGIDAEDALRQASRRFSDRFVRVESIIAADGLDLAHVGMDAKLALWERAKGGDSAQPVD